jgi:predicted dehydrogenase
VSRRRSILVVGAGSIGERHIRCFAATGRADLSVCEINDTLRTAVAERYHLRHQFAKVEEALKLRPEAVVICTPAHTHIPIALAAAEAGAHLLLEKPLSTTFHGVDDLQQAVARRQLSAAVAYVYRAHPVLTAMRAALQAGQLGQPVQIVVVAGQHFPFYRPAYREIYYKSRASGGGAVQDALTHLVNAAEWLVGPVDSVVADAAHQLLPGVEVEDTVHVLTRHGRVMGVFSMNQYQPPNETTITVLCEQGAARFEMHNSAWSRATQPGAPWQLELKTDLERDTLFTRQAEAFLDTLEGLRPPLCTLAEGIQTLRVNLAILDSVEKRAWQQLKPAGAVYA